METITDQYLQLDHPTLRTMLLERVGDVYAGESRAQIERALGLAEQVHENEKRDEGSPYIVHPIRVTLRLMDFVPNAPADEVCAALLHDTIESGGTTAEEIGLTCSDGTARMVEKLTHNGIEPKSSYLTAFVSTPRRIQRIKLADRLDNVWGLMVTPDVGRIPKYLQDTEDYVLSWGRMGDKQMSRAIEDAMAVAAKRAE